MTNTSRDDVDLYLPLDTGSGPAKRISSQRAVSMIEAALASMDLRALDAKPETAMTAAPGLMAEPVAAPATRPGEAPIIALRPRRRWQAMLVAAAVVTAAGVASAALYQLAHRGDEPRAPEPAPVPAVVAPAAEPEPEIVIEPEPENEPENEPEIIIEPEPERPARTSRRKAPEPAAPAPRPPRSPEDLLKLANQERKARSWRAADDLYQQVIRTHAGSQAAYVAHVASASIHLEHLRDARGALSLYQAALSARPSGTLAEEARYGVAEAHRRLGNRAAEARALQTFLAKHPDSPLVNRARDRLATLGGANP